MAASKTLDKHFLIIRWYLKPENKGSVFGWHSLPSCEWLWGKPNGSSETEDAKAIGITNIRSPHRERRGPAWKPWIGFHACDFRLACLLWAFGERKAVDRSSLCVYMPLSVSLHFKRIRLKLLKGKIFRFEIIIIIIIPVIRGWD